MKGLVLVLYGMGGAGIETWESGLRQFVRRCKAAGYETMSSPYNWDQGNVAAGLIRQAQAGAPIAVVGASLGNLATMDVAKGVSRTVRYCGGFQGSIWGKTSGLGVLDVPANVDYADNIYNPGLIGFIRTFGMGSVKWRRAAGNQHTIVRNIPVYASHPDDWGIAQDVIFGRLHHMLG